MYDYVKTKLGDTFTIRSRGLVTPDPVLFDMDSDEALEFLLPTLGPSATLVAHRCARLLRAAATVELPTVEFSRFFGLTPFTFNDAMDRLGNFGYAAVIDGVWAMNTQVNYFPIRWVERMPRALADALREWQRLVALDRRAG